MPLIQSTTHANNLDSKVFHPVINMGVNMDQVDNHYNKIVNNCSYTSIVDKTIPTIESNAKLNILHVNCRSIYSDEKFDDFLLFLQRTDLNWSVICLSESWLTDLVESKKNIDGYNSYFENRKHSHGGGVAIYGKNDIESRLCKTNGSITCTEFAFVECKLSSNVKFIVGVIY